MLFVGTWRYYSPWRYYGSWQVMVVTSYALLVLCNLVKKIAFELCKWFCKVVSKQGICEWFWMWGVNEVWGLTHINSTCYLHSFKWNIALTGPTGQPSDRLKPLSFLLFSTSWKTDCIFVWIFPPWDLEKLQYTRVNILDLKFLQVFFKK